MGGREKYNWELRYWDIVTAETHSVFAWIRFNLIWQYFNIHTSFLDFPSDECWLTFLKWFTPFLEKFTFVRIKFTLYWKTWPWKHSQVHGQVTVPQEYSKNKISNVIKKEEAGHGPVPCLDLFAYNQWRLQMAFTMPLAASNCLWWDWIIVKSEHSIS